MTNIDKVNKFSKTYFKVSDFAAKHVISLANYGFDNKQKEVSRGPIYVYDVSDKRTREMKKALSISTTDTIILSNNAQNAINVPSKSAKEGNEKLKGGGFVFLTPQDFDKVLECLEKCVSWLCDEEYASLFTVDASGNTVGVTENNEVAIARFKQGWLMFKPAVIFDKNGAGYQGIYIKCDRGVLTSLTGTEFKEFYNYTKEIMTNFYQSGLALYNAGILSMILHKE